MGEDKETLDFLLLLRRGFFETALVLMKEAQKKEDKIGDKESDFLLFSSSETKDAGYAPISEAERNYNSFRQRVEDRNNRINNRNRQQSRQFQEDDDVDSLGREVLVIIGGGTNVSERLSE